jgi:nicotinamidase-related amidase
VTGVMSNICVYHAVLGFHVRDFYTILPLDCTIGSPHAEDFVIAQFSNFAYEYNVWLTTSQRIRIAGWNR